MSGQDLTGQVFGALVALRITRADDGRARWECLCDPAKGGCGAVTAKRAQNLTGRYTASCGCLYRRSLGHASKATSGQSPEYRTWARMIYRCENPGYDSFSRYGGRGITVCERWRRSFAAFLADMGTRPSPRHSIDRIDNDGNYEPGNCRWATRTEQARNVETNCRLTARGETKCLAEWVPVAAVTANTIRARIRAGWDAERAIFERATKGPTRQVMP